MSLAQKPAVVAAPVLVFGTGNRKKAAELADLVASLPLTCKSLADFGDSLAVEEAGQSFAENAAIKATQQASHLGAWVLGDDSGLIVDALHGAPGIYSARFAGPTASDEDNRRKLLAELAPIELPRRTARFECHLALADPCGNVRAVSEGRCQGRIRLQESGSGGFGYDPLFELVEYHRTFGELSPAVKACLSHRARAMHAMAPQIADLIATGQFAVGNLSTADRGARG